MTNLVALSEGTELVSDYRVKRVLGAGGFGITYLAEETPLARLVTIKEYFPVDFAARDQADDVAPRSRDSEGDYKWGLERFIAEAQTLAKFTHPNIVRVYRYFRARNTGYIVLHFEEGPSFKGWLQGLGRAPRQQELDRILLPLLEALEVIHSADFLHRDIAPDNIIIRKDGQPVLIDFGSARGDIAKHTKTLSALVKPGYSPYEQYATTSSRQGPWTDIYSLAATLYHAVTGKRPADAPSRMVADELVPVRDAALSSYRPGFLAAIDRAMTLDMAKRPQSVADWRAELMAPPKPNPGWGSSWTAGRKDKDKAKLEPAVAPPMQAGAESPEPVASRPSPIALRADGHRVSSSSASFVGGAVASPRGLIGAFVEGWRKAAVIEVPAGAAAAPVGFRAAPVEPASVNVTPVPAPVERAHPKPKPVAAAPSPRMPPPRALRVKGRWPWKSLAAKLLIGLGIAAAAVALQDRLPSAGGDKASPHRSIPTTGG